MTQPLRHAKVLGLGTYVPPRVVTNDDLCTYMDTSDQWITRRTGVKERRWVEIDQTTSDLALIASERALESAGLDKDDIGMIVMATSTPDQDAPGTGCFLQTKLGMAKYVPALDIRQACAGFIYALSIGDQFIRTGFCDKVLVVGAEIHSKVTQDLDPIRELSVMFGDGAGALVLGAVEGQPGIDDSHILSSHLHTDGTGADKLGIRAPGINFPSVRLTHEMLERKDHLPYMNGSEVFLHAVQRMPEAVHEALEANHLTAADVDLFVFHQANLRIIEMVAKVLGIPDDKVVNTIHRHGNTTAATLPLCLDEARKLGKLKDGSLVMMAAFGSGFSWGSALVRW